MYQIIIIFVLIAAVLMVRHISRQPAAARRSLAIKYLGYGVVGVVMILALTGKVHWLGIAIAALIPLMGKLSVWGLRLLPFLQQWRIYKRNHKPSTTTSMNYQDALALFGLSAEAATDKQQIIQRHRQLMQKNHPDHGGSDYLASKINEAKAILLQAIKK